MIVEIKDNCDAIDKEKQENFWIHKLKTLYPNGLNQERII